MPKRLTKAEMDALQKAKVILTEHFENIAIFGNWTEEDGSTSKFEMQVGNWFALIFHIENWIDRQPSGFDPVKDESSQQDCDSV